MQGAMPNEGPIEFKDVLLAVVSSPFAGCGLFLFCIMYL